VAYFKELATLDKPFCLKLLENSKFCPFVYSVMLQRRINWSGYPFQTLIILRKKKEQECKKLSRMGGRKRNEE
jgi:hypothetical protein